MCLWHPALLPFMPDKTLERLFRTCCGLRQNWRGEASTKQAPFFVRQGLYEQLITYQQLILHEMQARGLDWDAEWDDIQYMGTSRPFLCIREDWLSLYIDNPYPFMDEKYLRNQILWLRNHGKPASEILKDLRQKGFRISENLF